MLKNFFKLNQPFRKFDSQQELIDSFARSNDLRNILYSPYVLEPRIKYSTVRFRDKNFTKRVFPKINQEGANRLSIRCVIAMRIQASLLLGKAS